MRHGAVGDPDDVTPDSDWGWNPDALGDAFAYPGPSDRARGRGTDPELFYEGRPDEWGLDSLGISVVNLGDHPEHLEQTEELRRGFSIITPPNDDEPDYGQ